MPPKVALTTPCKASSSNADDKEEAARTPMWVSSNTCTHSLCARKLVKFREFDLCHSGRND